VKSVNRFLAALARIPVLAVLLVLRLLTYVLVCLATLVDRMQAGLQEMTYEQVVGLDSDDPLVLAQIPATPRERAREKLRSTDIISERLAMRDDEASEIARRYLNLRKSA